MSWKLLTFDLFDLGRLEAKGPVGCKKAVLLSRYVLFELSGKTAPGFGLLVYPFGY